MILSAFSWHATLSVPRASAAWSFYSLQRKNCHEVLHISWCCQPSFRDGGIAAIDERPPRYLGHSHKCTLQCLNEGGSSTTSGEGSQGSFARGMWGDWFAVIILNWNDNKRQWKTCGRQKIGEESWCETFKKWVLNSEWKLSPCVLIPCN